MGGVASVAAGIVFATAPAEDGGPAAALPYDGSTVLRRLLEQLESLGIAQIHVVTRRAFAAAVEPSLEGLRAEVRLHACADPAEDVAVVARVARASRAGVVIAYGDIVTHREALAGLLADPRLATGILASSRKPPGVYCFRTRSSRGRVLSASSPYHSVERPSAAFIGVLKVDGRDQAALADAAERLAPLLRAPLPPGWVEEFERKRLREEERLAADPERERTWLPDVAAQDVPALLVTALVRSGVHVGNRYLRSLFWARPLSRAQVSRAAKEIAGYDEDRVLLDSAVKASDGFFTTFFVSPYSRYIARWMARMGRTPNQVTVLSMAVGAGAAAAFATGSRTGLVVGAILLQLAFTFDCVDGQLARYTRTFSRFGAWLDSVFDRGKEYLVFAGLAIGSTRGFGVDAWPLAALALALQTARHSLDFSYGTIQHVAMESAPLLPLEQASDNGRAAPAEAAKAAPAPDPLVGVDGLPGGPPPVEPGPPRPLRALPVLLLRVARRLDRPRGVRWAKRIVVFPIGERFAAISLTSALATPRTTFIVLIAWGSFAACYALTGRLLRSLLA